MRNYFQSYFIVILNSLIFELGEQSLKFLKNGTDFFSFQDRIDFIVDRIKGNGGGWTFIYAFYNVGIIQLICNVCRLTVLVYQLKSKECLG